MATKKTPSEGKSMDIAKGGKITPDETSRPMIVENRKVVQDPMVNEPEKNEEASQAEPIKSPLSKPKTIQPLSTQSKPEEKTDNSTDSSQGEAVAEDKKDAAVVDAVVEQAAHKDGDQPSENEDLEEKRKQETITKLIESKKYFLPIGEITKHKNNQRAVGALIFLLMIIAGAYLAIDANVIPTSVNLPFEFIK